MFSIWEMGKQANNTGITMHYIGTLNKPMIERPSG
jgi:hypothetical protein